MQVILSATKSDAQQETHRSKTMHHYVLALIFTAHSTSWYHVVLVHGLHAPGAAMQDGVDCCLG